MVSLTLAMSFRLLLPLILVAQLLKDLLFDIRINRVQFKANLVSSLILEVQRLILVNNHRLSFSLFDLSLILDAMI